MIYKVPQNQFEQIWKNLLSLKDSTNPHAEKISDKCKSLDLSSDNLRNDIEHLEIDVDIKGFLRLYLPILAGHLTACKTQTPFIYAHLAQTLDGKIACHNGQSQWISNKENLIHAHRLRALADAVLVGWKTVSMDNCKLSVRHVAGSQPKKIILDPNSQLLKQDIHSFELFQNNNESDITTYYLTAGKASRQLPSHMKNVIIDSSGLRSTFQKLCLRSVFVEGGANTISKMFESLDLFHLHTSPRILGSGISSFDFEPVDSIDAGYNIDSTPFLLGNEVLYECQVH